MFRKMFFTNTVLFVVMSTILADPGLPKCNVGDTDCVENVAQQLFSDYYGGYPRWNLSSIDPLFISSMNLSPLPDNPLNLQMDCVNVTDTGFRNTKIVSISGFGETPEGEHKVVLKLPYANVIGGCTFSGSAFGSPVNSTGTLNFTGYGLEKTLTFNGTSVIRNNATYLGVEDFSFSFDGTGVGVELQLYDLPEYSACLNERMSANKLIFAKAYRPSITAAFRLVYENIVKKVFNSTPYPDLLNINI